MQGRRLPLILVVLCFGLTACSTPGASQRTPPPHLVRQAAPPSSVVWTITGDTRPASLDPAQATDPAAIDICQLIDQGLVRMTDRLRVAPAAAESWTKGHNGLRYTFLLRPGLRFSTGRLLTAGDAVGSLLRALGPASSNGIMTGYLSELARTNGKPNISAVGSRRVQFVLSRQSPQFLTKLAFVGASIVDMATVHRYGPLWTAHEDGLGPFRIIASHADGSLNLAPNPFFRPRPSLSRLTVNFASARAAERAFQQGRTNVVSVLSAGSDLKSRFPQQLHPATLAALDYLVLNARHRPLQNAEIRRGLALSINRRQLTSRLFGASASPVGSLVPSPLLPGAYQQVYDPPAALRQLQLAGHAFGGHLPHFRFIFPKTSLEEKRARLLQSMWIHVLGMPVMPVALPAAAYAAAVRSRHFDIALVRWGAEYPDAADFLDKQLYGHAADNFSGWTDIHFDRLIDASRRTGIDSPQRRQDLLGAEQIGASQAPWIPLDSPIQTSLISPGLHGLAMTAEGLMGWATASTSTGFASASRY